jgi:peroxiredoxin
VHATRRESAPLIIAIGDGESPEQAAEIAKERNLPYLVLADPDRLVSRAFGVWCWPATVWIRADQRVEAVDFGVATSYADASASSR